MKIKNQFKRNIGILTVTEQERLNDSTVAVIGLGCTGSVVVEYLARAGVGGLILVDGDIYDETNINRQLNATHSTIGKSKSVVTAERVIDINPQARVQTYQTFLSEENAAMMITKSSLVISGVDDTLTMVILHRSARRIGIPCIMVLGGCIPFQGALTTFFKDSPIDYETLMGLPTKGRELQPLDAIKEELFDKITKRRALSGIKRGAYGETWLAERLNGGPVPSFPTASNITGILAAHEAVKILIDRFELPPVSSPNLLYYDGATNEMKILRPTNGKYWDQGDF